MQRIAALAAVFSLSIPLAVSAEEPKPEPSKPVDVVRELKTQAGAPRTQTQVVPAPGGAGFQMGGVVGTAASGTGQAGAAQLEQQKALQARMTELAKQAQASHREMLRQRVRRQRELTKQSSKLLKQLDELKPEEQARTQQLLMQIEQTQAQLRQTFGPSEMIGGGMFGGVMSGSGRVGPEGGVWSVKTWPNRPGVVEVNGQRIAPPGATPQPMQPITVQSFNPGPHGVATFSVSPAPASPDAMKAIDDLRRQIEQLRGEVRKLSEKK